jgi:hypothetical protein
MQCLLKRTLYINHLNKILNVKKNRVTQRPVPETLLRKGKDSK